MIQVTYALGEGSVDVVDWLQRMISDPTSRGRCREIGWLGVTAVATWIGYAIANWRIALLVAASFFSFGLFGYWSDSMDLLIVTVVSVAIAVVIGMPLAVWIGTSPRANAVISRRSST